MSAIVVEKPATDKRERANKSGRPARNLVTAGVDEVHRHDRAILRAARVSGLLGNPHQGRTPVISAEHPPSPRPDQHRLTKMFTSAFPVWNRCGPMLKATYETIVLATRGDGTAALGLSLRISERRLVPAIGFKRGPLEHLRREIKRKLEVKLQRQVEFWLAAEIEGHQVTHLRNFHIHGALGLRPDEIKVARKVLREIGGIPRAAHLTFIHDPRSWLNIPATDVDLRSRYKRNPARWGGYVFKDLPMTNAIVPGSLFTDTGSLRDSAEQLWHLHRAILRQTVGVDHQGSDKTAQHPEWGSW
jgi:hypothetical protein